MSPVLTESWSNEIGSFLHSSNLEVSNSKIFSAFSFAGCLKSLQTQNLQYPHRFIIKHLLTYIKTIT